MQKKSKNCSQVLTGKINPRINLFNMQEIPYFGIMKILDQRSNTITI
ncbi:MAG: hypothetical protein KBF45_05500 [Cyclobacteriaceae bacterium]|nr:hypothetical protein [Cyclobacteriaceae bacterium]